MNPSANDPDDLVRKRVDLDHVANMSHQMHVPDSITVGPSGSVLRRHDDNVRLPPVRMEVPACIRPGGNDSMIMVDNNDLFVNNDPTPMTNFVSPPTVYRMDVEPVSDDDFATVSMPNNVQNGNHVYPSYVETSVVPNDKDLLNKIQTLQNRIVQIERRLAAREARNRWLYPCVIGYALVQLFLSLRRSMLN